MAFENITLWHERDISHSSVERVVLSDAITLLDYMLRRFTKVIEQLVVHESQMIKNIHLTKGLVFSQKVLHALIDKNVSRDEAYDIVQPLALKAKAEDSDFQTLLKANETIKAYLNRQEIEACFNYLDDLKHVDTLFKRVGIL